MDIWLLFAFLILLLTISAFWNYLFPTCLCCNKSKFMTYFAVYNKKDFSISSGKRRLVCKKCRNKYCISTIQEIEELRKIKKQISSKLNLD
jgi:RNase P subunit RPR2